jgi:hypothetical protein
MPRKKTVNKIPSVQKDKRLPYSDCIRMTVRQIRQSDEYKGLTPLGKQNASGAYHYGSKSTMNKESLCRALDNPKRYQEMVKKFKEKNENMGPRKRSTRKGQCLVAKRKVPCITEEYKYEGVTTTGERCCFKNKMSKKTIEKRLKSVQDRITNQNKSAKKRKRGRPKKTIKKSPAKKPAKRGRPKKKSV